jgi:serine/threonine-protein kinase
VKVLDFGLAKAMEQSPGTALSNSPTLLSVAASNVGVILGTAGYMSPEQAKGKPVDKRADIWAFGVVLYEMLTGRMLFSGETVSETMAFVMTREPDWNALPKDTPSPLRELLRRCLVKDPRNRLRDIGDVRLGIGEIIVSPDQEAAKIEVAAPSVPRWRQRERFAWSALAVITIIAVVLAVLILRSPLAGPVTRVSMELGTDVSLSTSQEGSSVILSPDGKMLALVASKLFGNRTQIYIRRLDQLQATLVTGTENAQDAFSLRMGSGSPSSQTVS